MKYLVFTHQPTRIIIKGIICDKSPNEGEFSHDKERNAFIYDLTAGFQLSHGRDWELLEVKALTGNLTISKKKYDGADYDVQTIPEETIDRTHRHINAKEVLYFSGGSEFELTVREYESSRRGV